MKRIAWLFVGAVVLLPGIAAIVPTPALAQEKKVLVIGVDGMRPDALAFADTPNIDSLIDGTFAGGTFNGAYSAVAQVDPISSVSGTNYSDILTGVFAAKHGVVGNGFSGINFGAYPDFFSHVEDFAPALNTFRLIRWGSGANQMPTGADHVINIETTRFYGGAVRSSDVGNTDAVVQLLSGTHPTIPDDPDAIFHFFSGPDGFGHTFGYGPDVPEYVGELENVDSLIGQELAAMAARPNFANEDWLVIITSDHGGGSAASGPTGHGGNQPLDRTVPFLVAGRSVTAGEPTTAPDLVDVAPTVLAHMGVPISLDWGLDGHVVGVDALPFGDLNFDDIIDERDWWLLRDNHLSDMSGLSLDETYPLGDLDGDRDNDEYDFGLFKNVFDEANGVGAFDTMLAGVPEPSALLMAGCGIALFAACRRRDADSTACKTLFVMGGIPNLKWFQVLPNRKSRQTRRHPSLRRF